MKSDSRRERPASARRPDPGRKRTAREAVTQEAQQLVRSLDKRYEEQQHEGAAGRHRVKLGGPGHFGGGELDDASH